MKFYIAGFLFLGGINAACASDYIISAYDSGLYHVVGAGDLATLPANTLSSISNIYYKYDIVNQTLEIKQTEWVSDGAGGEYQKPDDSIYHYKNVSFNDLFEFTPGISESVLQHMFSQYEHEYIIKPSKSTQQVNALRYIMRQNEITAENTILNHLESPESIEGNLFGVWGTTQFGHMKKTGDEGFSADSFGVLVGADKKINNHFIFGAGYKYDTVNFLSSDLQNHMMIIYGQYKKQKAYLNSMAHVSLANYDDGSSDSVSLSVVSGYNTSLGLSPQVGIRHTYMTIDSDNDYVKKYDANILTALSGIKYSYENSKLPLSLNARIMLSYDLIPAKDRIKIDIPAVIYEHKASYDMAPLGVESGFAINFIVENINFTIGYDLDLRSHFTGHTGAIRAQYIF